MKNIGFRALTNFLAYIAVILIATALILVKINIAPNVSLIFEKIANILAYVLVGLSSLCFALSKRSLLIKIVWLAAAAVIVVMVII